MLYESRPCGDPHTLSHTVLWWQGLGLPSEYKVSSQQEVWVLEVDSISGLGQDSLGKNLEGALMCRKTFPAV